MRNLKIAALVAGAFALAMPAIPADAQNRGQHKGTGAHPKAGKPTGHAKTSANRAPYSGQQANRGGGTVNKGGSKKGGNNIYVDNSKTVVAGNNRPGSSGYYDNGNYHGGGHYYDDDDDDFLEFVGKTAAVTAGVSVVAAVIGSTTNSKPDDCQPVNANGISYMYCNGTYYQQSGPTSQPTYTVVAPPQ